ncbi:hypothetical protein AGABI2DRAFT_179059 [Agaricus bisporus var. bisporus H97]|uniref:hypothetical protein n=1 Tax=Agaricus bisporus var. bisporus (strain H97 / ATCC MYA-4626 / FGSC 10389) TaxID=936046 RepID=UPI00029F71F9|nr:hypothetical protein AGABI2DRAFT_179059 [Agaricus bisporus var. bisporus H97]EKV46881.1 hypothetical protein AGABI2DRAFT_179059 [Agaricus bisporus var. bisporus H97]
MCCPNDGYRPERDDKYLGHRLVGQKFANYITRSPTLHRPSSRSPRSSPETGLPLDLYIARTIHASRVPDIVAYTALYLLASISQVCQCKVPHDEDKSTYNHSTPSKLSHTLSRAVTRTPFSRAIKPHWGERHFFMGAFFLALSAYKPVFEKEFNKELRCWRMVGASEVSQEEVVEVSEAFKQCMSKELETAVKSMMWDKFVINVSEFDCPHARARERRLSNVEEEEEEEDEKSKKKRMGLKRSISSFWKPREKVIPVGDSCDCGPYKKSGVSGFLF